MWETPEEESISKLLDEMKSVFFTIPLEEMDVALPKDRNLLQDVLQNLQASIDPQSRIYYKRSQLAVTDAFWKVIHLCLTYWPSPRTVTVYILLIKANSHNDMNSREVLTVRKHPHTHIRNNIVEFLTVEITILQFSIPNGNSPPRDCFLRVQPGARRFFNSYDMAWIGSSGWMKIKEHLSQKV